MDKNFLDSLLNDSMHSYIGKVVGTNINSTISDKTLLTIWVEFDIYDKKYYKLQLVFYEFDFDKIIKI